MLQHPPSGSTPAHASSAAGPKGYPPRPGAGIITGRHCRDRSAGEGGEKEGTHAASEGGPETRRRRASLARPFRPAMHPNGRRHPNATTAAWASHSRKPGPGQRQIRTSRTPAGPFLSLPYLPTYCTITPPSTNQTSQRNTTEDPCYDDACLGMCTQLKLNACAPNIENPQTRVCRGGGGEERRKRSPCRSTRSSLVNGRERSKKESKVRNPPPVGEAPSVARAGPGLGSFFVS